ncbi:MAG: MATE family efflux transporter [Brevinema sp.]
MPTTKFLKEENIFKMILSLSLPAILAGFIDSLYNTVDSIFVGYFVGTEALAALSIINVIQLLFISIGVLFSVGNSSIVSRALGAKNHHRAVKTLIHSFWGTFVVAFSLSMIFLLNLDYCLGLIGATPDILPYARSYGAIVLWTSFILPLNNMMLGALRAQGQVAQGMYFSVMAAVLNIILDAVFIVGFQWGVAGAAIATAISQAVLFLFLFMKIKKLYKTNLCFSKEFEIHFPLFKEVIAVGFPTGMRLMLFVGVFSLANNVLSSYGSEYLSAFGVFTRVINVLGMIIVSLTMGGQPLIGLNYGAELYERVKKITATVLATGVGVGLISSLLLVFAPAGLYQLFTPNETIIKICQEISLYEGLTYWGWAVFLCIVEALQAMGHARTSFCLSITYPMFVSLFLTLLPEFFGVKGVWLAFSATYILIAIFGLIALLVDFRHIDKKIAQLKLGA